jgi:hypothetical protein|tara:strand:+ start:603 stop:890 length:288 start_codon:yes stop_codon:yes gene_type:complete
MKDSDEYQEIKMPRFLSSIIWGTFGVCGYFLVTSSGQKPELLWLMTAEIVFRGIFSGFAWFGLISAIRDIRKHGSVRNAFNEFKKDILDLTANDK